MAVTASGHVIRLTASGDSTTSVYPGKIHVRHMSIHAGTAGAGGTQLTITIDGIIWFNMGNFPIDSAVNFEFGGGQVFDRIVATTLPAGVTVSVTLC